MNEHALFFILAVSAILGVILHVIFLKFLKNNYNDTWTKIGKPSIFFNNSMKNNLKVNKYISRHEYRKLNNKKLTIIGNILDIYGKLYLVFFICIIIYIIFSQSF